LSLNLKWKLKQDKNLCVAECTIGDMQAMAVYRKKRTAKLLAAKNMLKVIEGNSQMKTKLLNFLYGNNVGQPLSEGSTNIGLIADMKSSLKTAVDSMSGQRNIACTKNIDEPHEILKWFQS
jgi:hypothetical protein